MRHPGHNAPVAPPARADGRAALSADRPPRRTSHIAIAIIGSAAVASLAGAAVAQEQVETAPSRAAVTSATAPSCTTAGCHAETTRHQHVHQPVAMGRCDLCHEPEAGATPFQAGAKHEFKRAGDNPRLCYACHEPLAEEAYVHPPVKAGVCILCHDPHGAEQAFLLRVATDRELCMQCHRETRFAADHVHGPVSLGACGACHDPHQSPNRFRLRGEGARQCGMCHLTDLPGIIGAARTHKPVAEDCSNCHEPHSSANSFRLSNPRPTLCLDCHDDIARQIRLGVSVHEPVRQGRCNDCHEPHGGAQRRLLRANFTPNLYESFGMEHYALCYRCHPASQIMEAKTTTATGFRNGEKNLHNWHVNQAVKGRTCNACHEVHASGNPRLIRDKVRFGTWQASLNYQKTQTGGSCLPLCHVQRGYDRVTAVRNK